MASWPPQPKGGGTDLASVLERALRRHMNIPQGLSEGDKASIDATNRYVAG